MEKMIAIHTVTEQALLVHYFGQNPQNLTQKDVKPDSRALGTGYFPFSSPVSCLLGADPWSSLRGPGCPWRVKTLPKMPREDPGVGPGPWREDQQPQLFVLFLDLKIEQERSEACPCYQPICRDKQGVQACPGCLC